MTEYLITAVIPAFNAEPFIGDAIESVLTQTHRSVECLVVDDGSQDATRRVVQRAGQARLITQPHAGVSAARNFGVRKARGRLIAFLDADDTWQPTKLERQLSALKAAEGDGGVLCGLEVVDAHRNHIREQLWDVGADLVRDLIMFDRSSTVSCSSTLLIHRDVFDTVGGFDPALSTSADWHLLVRLAIQFPVSIVNEPLTRYRVHDSNMSSSVHLFAGDMLRAFDDVFADPLLPPGIRSRRRIAYANLHRTIAGSYFVEGNLKKSAEHAAAALRRRPSTAGYFLAYPWRRIARRTRASRLVPPRSQNP
jgi:glycosyltransferase involved in cell wall biosynthesis